MRARPGRFAPLPPGGAGQTVGLFGGSFDPPHAGHAHVVRTAMARLGLDRIWVLVTPGNPLKASSPLAPIGDRVAAAARLMANARVTVTDYEARAGLRYTRDTVRDLVRRAPALRFVWIMGADGLANLHRWRGWREIAQLVPIAVIDRPGATLAALSAPAAQSLSRRRRPEAAASTFAAKRAPAWTFLHARRRADSSTALRHGRGSA